MEKRIHWAISMQKKTGVRYIERTPVKFKKWTATSRNKILYYFLTTKALAIISCKPCLRSVKPAIKKPM